MLPHTKPAPLLLDYVCCTALLLNISRAAACMCRPCCLCTQLQVIGAVQRSQHACKARAAFRLTHM